MPTGKVSPTPFSLRIRTLIASAWLVKWQSSSSNILFAVMSDNGLTFYSAASARSVIKVDWRGKSTLITELADGEFHYRFADIAAALSFLDALLVSHVSTLTGPGRAPAAVPAAKPDRTFPSALRAVGERRAYRSPGRRHPDSRIGHFVRPNTPGAAAALAVSQPSTLAGSDDSLLAECAEFAATDMQLRAWNAGAGLSDADSAMLTHRWQDALERLTELRPQTSKGLHAKLRATHAALQSVSGDLWGAEERAALSVLCDVLGVDRARSRVPARS